MHVRRKRDVTEPFAFVRGFVNKWDPIGLLSMGAPLDEYDCLVRPLLAALRRDGKPMELQRWLRTFIPDHFAVSAPPDIADFVRSLRTAWESQAESK